MRQLGGGLRKSTPRQLLLREFGCQPLARSWLHSMLGMWNRIATMQESTLLRTALRENMALSLPSSWFSGFTALLTVIGAVPAPAESVLCPEGSLKPLSQSMVFEKFDAWFYQCWQDLPQDPRSAPSGKVTCCKYQQWFASEGGCRAPW